MTVKTAVAKARAELDAAWAEKWPDGMYYVIKVNLRKTIPQHEMRPAWYVLHGKVVSRPTSASSGRHAHHTREYPQGYVEHGPPACHYGYYMGKTFASGKNDIHKTFDNRHDYEVFLAKLIAESNL